ncbi:MAG: hypothetical protein US42_C0003G0012 [Candidatus Magasanikbacteria bacterium GW2011_GWC2_37_14]|uniref:SGNH hydrolase-type esterase domain-containing protein n=1 Tax=Candidatus Magasanikbacteria bacterium GW2011_GWC2_37_14 TaxID=1619046 RepID=A0A0G0GP66_9BACT|nr:MAG: hypothetical protein US42_C0003G0012 [Candidatus Magasanikbacteria bacterium GW2011_GWC2_37_14]
MKKIFLATLIIILALAVYLNRTYAHIYNTISKANLPSSPSQKNYFLRSEDACGERSGITPQQVKNNFSCEKIKIAFLGDSLTAGVGVKWQEDTYPYQLAQKIANEQKKQVEVLNLGVPGATSVDVLNNQIALANNFTPDKVIIFIGINDLHNFVDKIKLENNLKQIINNLKIEEKNIYIVDLPYLGSKKSFLWPWQYYFYYQTEKYNEAINNVLRNSETNSLDTFLATSKSFFKDTTWYSADNFHPNSQGYEQIANSIYTYLYNVSKPL